MREGIRVGNALHMKYSAFPRLYVFGRLIQYMD